MRVTDTKKEPKSETCVGLNSNLFDIVEEIYTKVAGPSLVTVTEAIVCPSVSLIDGKT